MVETATHAICIPVNNAMQVWAGNLSDDIGIG